MSTPPREVPPFLDIFLEKPCGIKKTIYLCTRKPRNGVIAQLVEQRTENPCVPGSIPGGTTLQVAECSAVGSALRSGRRGRAFESPHSDKRKRD